MVLCGITINFPEAESAHARPHAVSQSIHRVLVMACITVASCSISRSSLHVIPKHTLWRLNFEGPKFRGTHSITGRQLFQNSVVTSICIPTRVYVYRPAHMYIDQVICISTRVDIHMRGSVYICAGRYTYTRVGIHIEVTTEFWNNRRPIHFVE